MQLQNDKVFLKVDGMYYDAGLETDIINQMNAEGIEDFETTEEINEGDQVQLTEQTQEVVACQETGVLMLNIDADELQPGDLTKIKRMGLTISNPETDKPVALGVDLPEKEDSFGRKVASWFESDDDDDSSFFTPMPTSSSGFSFGGGFGGFGGGGFSGGGVSRGF